MAVLDASAVLAVTFAEAGAEAVAPELPNAMLSAVNLSEVYGRIIRRGGDIEPIPDFLERYDIEVVPFDEELAEITAKLIPATRSHGLSLGDRACLALALQRGLPVMTADRAWRDLDLGVEIRLIR